MRLSIKIVSRMSIHTIVISTGGAVLNGGHREGRQGAAVFFQRHHKASVLARECRHQVILPWKRSFANAGRIKPGRARVRRRRRAFSRRRHRSLREMAEATAGGVDAKLVRPSIQRICWLDGIGRGCAPHTAHVAYGSPIRPGSVSRITASVRRSKCTASIL